MALQVDPELCGRAEVAREAQCCVCADATLAVHDLIDAARWHADSDREPILGDPERVDEVFHQYLTGVDRGELLHLLHLPIDVAVSDGLDLITII